MPSGPNLQFTIAGGNPVIAGVGHKRLEGSMAWNWSETKARKLMRRKPVALGDGENTKEVQELANQLIRQGHTRQKAYAKARAKLKQEYRKRDAKLFSGGTCSKK